MAAEDRRLVALAVGTGRARRAVAPLPERHRTRQQPSQGESFGSRHAHGLARRWHRERRDRRQLVRDDLRSDEGGGRDVGGRCGLLLIIAWRHVQRYAIDRAAKS